MTGRRLGRVGAQLGMACFRRTVALVESRVMVTVRTLHGLKIAGQKVPAIPRAGSWPRPVGFADAGE
ncbi:hypothetical protein AB0H00_13365 [Nocardia sp. NPDC023852]|uniref:hypothetical protein n=1 Tax=Nocardia sp. NPDC023852 TaxID=3154697 RepID=UPI0033D15EA0